MQDDTLKVDIARTDRHTGAAADAGADQFGGIVEAVEKRGEDNADRADVNVAEDMTAHGLVDRADVGAGSAFDATQGVAAVRRLGQGGAAVVEQDDMQFLAFVTTGHCPADPGDVGGDQLPGGVLRQHIDDPVGIGERRHQFFHAHQGDMNFRQGRGQTGVALVGHQGKAAGFSDRNIGPGDPHVGIQVALAQLFACEPYQVQDLGRLFFTGDLAEQFGDFFLEHMNRRHHHMARSFPGQLDDPFAQVGLEGFNAGVLESMVEMGLLARHALAFDHGFDAALLGQVADVRVGLCSGPGNIDFCSGCLGVGDELITITGQVVTHLVLHLTNRSAQCLKILAGKGRLAGNNVSIGEAMQGILQARFRNGLADPVIVMSATVCFIHG